VTFFGHKTVVLFLLAPGRCRGSSTPSKCNLAVLSQVFVPDDDIIGSGTQFIFAVKKDSIQMLGCNFLFFLDLYGIPLLE
jgi:hypothetical protein